MKNIEELIQQAEFENYISGPYSVTSFDEYKFAELIINECHNIIKLSTLDYKSDDYYAGWLDMREKISNNIKHHFGIEDEN